MPTQLTGKRTQTVRISVLYTPRRRRRHSAELIRRRRRTVLALLMLVAFTIGMCWPYVWVKG